MNKIKLGDKVRCKWTGFTGTAVARTEYINGCTQWNVLPKVEKSNKMADEIAIDEQSLEVIKKKKINQEKKDVGGPMKHACQQRGF